MHLLKRDVSERRQFCRGSYRPGDKPWFVLSRKLCSDVLREPRGGEINFGDPIGKTKLSEHRAHPVERIRLNDIAPHTQETGMDVANNVWPAQYEDFVTVFLAPIVVESGVVHVDVSPHRAVINHNALFHDL